MKKWLLAAGLAVSVFGLSACNNGDVVMESKSGNVTKDELYEAMKEKYGEQTLQLLALEKVLSKEYKVSDKEVDKQVEEVKKQLGDQFQATLDQYGYKDEKSFRESIKLSLLQQKAITDKVKVTDDELKKYYDELKPDIKARHILVADEKTAKEVKAKLDAGEKFEDVSNTYSTDDVAKASGGDLGWFGKDAQMDADFLAAAFDLEKNEISEPVKSQFGYHIIQVTDMKKKESFDKMKKEITEKVKESKVDANLVQKTFSELFKKADVKVKDKDLEKAVDFSAPANQ